MSSKMLMVACAAGLMAVVAVPQAQAGLPWSKKNKEEASESKDAKPEGDVKRVTGRNGVEGEIIGDAKPGSVFSKLEIGMAQKQADDILHAAGHHERDCGSYRTGKSWIPYYHGGDTSRYECVYKGLGRLIFTDPSRHDSRTVLLKIVHDTSEDGYR